jgi:Mg2+ and Co2+ transporter CorA
LTLSSYIIDNIAIKPVNVISEAVSIRTEMKKMHEEYLWIHANEIEDIFPLQDIFGLHPLTVEAILHHNQPSKIEEYTRYIFAIIDGIADNQEKKMDETNNNKNNEKILSMMVLEDDLYIS